MIPLIASVGNANVDVTLTLDSIPGPDEEVISRGTLVSAGGSASNFAIACSRLGWPAAAAAVVGRDPLGDFYLSALREAGVLTNLVFRDPDLPTGLVIVMNEPGEQRRMILSPGANLRLGKDLISSISRELGMSEVVHVATGKFENALAVAELVEGPVSSWDPGFRVLSEAGRMALDLLPEYDRIFVNLKEARLLSGCSGPRDCLSSLVGPSEVIIKLGEFGAMASIEGEVYESPGYAVEVVDTTGAGDVFDAAYTVARLRGEDPGPALDLANACAALSIGTPGASRGIPTWDEAVRYAETGRRNSP